MPTYDIVYSKFLRLAAIGMLLVKTLFQIVAMVFFQEVPNLYAIGIMVLELAAAFVLYRGERSFLTMLPFLGIAVLENLLFFCSVDLAGTSNLHILSTILVAFIFVFSMVGRMYENRVKLIVIFFLLVAVWGYDIFVFFKGDKPLDLAFVRVLFLLPVAHGLAAAWASFPSFRHHLTAEEVEERLEQNKTMLTTGMISVKEYRNTMNMLLKCGEKK